MYARRADCLGNRYVPHWGILMAKIAIHLIDGTIKVCESITLASEAIYLWNGTIVTEKIDYWLVARIIPIE